MDLIYAWKLEQCGFNLCLEFGTMWVSFVFGINVRKLELRGFNLCLEIGTLCWKLKLCGFNLCLQIGTMWI